MDDKISIKFERDGLEQTYKFREADGFSNFADVERIVDQPLLLSLNEQFATMERTRFGIWQRHAPAGEDEFEEIV